MGDLRHFKMLEKLGLNVNSAQWIMYDDRFEKFYDHLAKNVKESNMLEERTILEYEEIIEHDIEHRYNDSERIKAISQLQEQYPGLMKDTTDNNDLEREISDLVEATDSYQKLLQQMKNTEESIKRDLMIKAKQFEDLQTTEINLQVLCQNRAERLEEQRAENLKSIQKADESFTKPHSPPLFMHQLPLEKFLHQLNSLQQLVWSYLEENYRIQNNSDSCDEDSDDNEYLNVSHKTLDIAQKLSKVANLMEKFQMGYINEKIKTHEIKGFIASMDISKVNINNLYEIKRDLSYYKMWNKNRESIRESIMIDIQRNIQQTTMQIMETVLYENTKLKLERAEKRYEHEQLIANRITNTLLTADLIWIAMHLDLDRKQNRLDNSNRTMQQFELCEKRINLMLQHISNNINPYKRNCNQFITQIQRLMGISQHSENNEKECFVNNDEHFDLKTHLYEYKKFTHLLKYSVINFVKGNHYTWLIDKCKEIDCLEGQLNSFLYNSPVGGILIVDISHSQRIHEFKCQLSKIKYKLKYLRKQFQENIAENMKTNKFWSYSQLLWMWYLIEPNRVVQAIEEIKREASKMPQMKTLMGIRRK